MSKIVIDARESGTTTGRYIDKLIENLHVLPSNHEFVILTHPERIEVLQGIAPRFTVLPTPYRAFSFGEQIGFRKQLRNLKPDLVHFTMVQQPIFYRGKTVTSMLDLTTLRFKNPSKNPFIFTIKQYIYKLVNKTAARKSDQIITISEYVKQDITRTFGADAGKITVTLNAADHINEKPKPVDGVRAPFIMYVGRPFPHKNLQRLIEAFQQLQPSFPQLQLVLAGKTDSLYEQIANTISIQDNNLQNILFTGFVYESQLRWLYEHTSAYVFPSLSEGFGLPGLEAMMHGAPVVSSNATCLPEIYEDAAVYFDPLDVNDIAYKIASVLNDKKLAESLKNRGHKRVKAFSWKKTAELTLQVYTQALEE